MANVNFPGFNTLSFSGGASNSNPALSIGGVRSSVKLYSNSVAWESSGITGITLLGGSGNAAGTGQLRYTYSSADDNDFISWKPPGAADFEIDIGVHEFTNIPNTIPGNNIIQYSGIADPGGILVVQIDDTLLPTANSTVNVTVGEVDLGLFPDISEAQAEAGLIRYRGIYVTQHAAYLQYLLPIVLQNSAGGDVIDLGWADEGKNATMETLANDETAPSNVTFFRGMLDNDSRKVTMLGADDYHGIWIRQTVPPMTSIGATASGVRIAVYS